PNSTADLWEIERFLPPISLVIKMPSVSSIIHFFIASDRISLSFVSDVNSAFFVKFSSAHILLASKVLQAAHKGKASDAASFASMNRCSACICLNMSPETALTVWFLPELSTISTILVIMVFPSLPSLFKACIFIVTTPEILKECSFILFVLLNVFISYLWRSCISICQKQHAYQFNPVFFSKCDH